MTNSRKGKSRARLHLDRMRREAAVREAYANNEPLASIAKRLRSTVGSVKVIANRIGCTKRGEEIYAYRRGFNIPEHLADEYRYLVTRKQVPHREAAAMLGLAASQYIHDDKSSDASAPASIRAE